jgi:hypothetical protein
VVESGEGTVEKVKAVNENAFQKYDRNSDGKIFKEEYSDSELSKGSESGSFESADKNEDGSKTGKSIFCKDLSFA